MNLRFINTIKDIFVYLDNFDKSNSHKNKAHMLSFGCYNEGWDDIPQNADWCKNYKFDKFCLVFNWYSIEKDGAFVDYKHTKSFNIVDEKTDEIVFVEYDKNTSTLSICG